jgi:signal transduction histidine kinase
MLYAPAVTTSFEELKRFVGFTQEDAQRLAEFRPIAAPHFERIARELYARMGEHERPYAALTREASVEDRVKFVVVWLERLLGGIYDESYVAHAEANGRAHVRVGLPQGFVVASTATIRLLLSRFADSAELREAIGRVLDLELAITTESHHEESRIRVARRARADAASRLATGFAHELRNPLNGAQLHLALLERELAARGINGEIRNGLKTVDGELKRLGRLVTDFLDFVRPKPYAFVAVDLRELCTQAVARVPVPDGAVVRLDLPPAAVCVMADPDALAQALVNVIENAVEAIPVSGGGAVGVRVHRERRAALVDVEDDGPGLASAEAPIFDAFYSTKAGGTGLGLAVAHRVVTDHGGAVDVETKPGRTRFRFRLPITESEQTRGT